VPLIDVRLRPGQWQIERRGASGARYRLRFQGSRFESISRLDEYKQGIGKPLYWRRMYTAYDNNRHPHGKLALTAFEDIGIRTKARVAEFISGQHARMTELD
jgi:hypothetical protein